MYCNTQIHSIKVKSTVHFADFLLYKQSDDDVGVWRITLLMLSGIIEWLGEKVNIPRKHVAYKTQAFILGFSIFSPYHIMTRLEPVTSRLHQFVSTAVPSGTVWASQTRHGFQGQIIQEQDQVSLTFISHFCVRFR